MLCKIRICKSWMQITSPRETMMGWQWRLPESVELSFIFRLWAMNLPCLCVSSHNTRKLGLCATHLGRKNAEESKLKVFCQVILCWIQNLDQRVQIPSPKYQPLKVPYSEVKKNTASGVGRVGHLTGESLLWKFLVWLWNTIRVMGQGNLTEVMTCLPLASPLQKGGGEDSVLRILPAQCCLQFKLLLNEGVGLSSQVIKGPAAQDGKRQPPPLPCLQKFPVLH